MLDGDRNASTNQVVEMFCDDGVEDAHAYIGVASHRVLFYFYTGAFTKLLTHKSVAMLNGLAIVCGAQLLNESCSFTNSRQKVYES